MGRLNNTIIFFNRFYFYRDMLRYTFAWRLAGGCLLGSFQHYLRMLFVVFGWGHASCHGINY